LKNNQKELKTFLNLNTAGFFNVTPNKKKQVAKSSSIYHKKKKLKENIFKFEHHWLFECDAV
jgi:hypothetical protein